MFLFIDISKVTFVCVYKFSFCFFFLTGYEKMENRDNDFFKAQMENRSDMGSSTPQDPHESDEVSSNPANETNDECNDAS